MRTFAIFSCAALFLTPLIANAQLRRAGAPGLPAVGAPGYDVVGNPVGAPGIPEVGPDVNLGGPINRRGLR
jgi:hypothetical protein